MKDETSKKIEKLVAQMPYFSINSLKGLASESYLRILLSRFAKREMIVKLKKGLYVSAEYIRDAKNLGKYSDFAEFMACTIYNPAYLSLDYVLYENGILTEIPVNFTLATRNKTAKFSNKIGRFVYHNIKPELFCGFNVARKGDMIIYKASKAKALFDFLYFRKNFIAGKESFNELRLNLENLSAKDKKEFLKYVKMEGSKKIKEVSKYV